jgi:hypothetical protein
MGFWSTIKGIFSLSGKDEAELQRLREKHGVNVEAKDKILDEASNDPDSPEYDPWEEIRNMRMNLFLGRWVTHKIKYRPISEEKVKKQLEDLAKKREEKERKKRGEGKIESGSETNQ